MSIASTSEVVFRGGSHVRALTIVRHPQARALRLSVDPRDATVRLSMPANAPLRPALAWALLKRDWVEARLARLPAPQPIAPGSIIPLGDRRLVLDWSVDHPRGPAIDGGRLRVGGPRAQLPDRVLRWLRREALARLTAATHSLAARHAITVTRVGVGDPVSRWGSCAASGAIRYSWRLVLAPEHVLHATVAHEVAHRVHMNHGPAFHRLAAELLGHDPAPARRWLRAHGAALHWFGRTG